MYYRDGVLKWMKSLKITQRPSKNSRLCANHFLESDFVRDHGRRSLREYALPKNKNCMWVGEGDHTYSLLSKSVDAGNKTIIFTVATLLMCWVPFLVLFCYCFENEDTSTDLASCGHTSSRIVPVYEGTRQAKWNYFVLYAWSLVNLY